MAAFKNTHVLILAVLPLLLLTTPLFSTAEMGAGAGYSFSFPISPEDRVEYSTLSGHDPGPLSICLDLFTDHVFNLRMQAGWNRFSINLYDIFQEGTIDSSGRLVLNGQNRVLNRRSQLYCISLSPLVKIASRTFPLRYYGTAGLGIEIPVAIREKFKSRVSWDEFDRETEIPKVLFPLMIGGGVDYLISNWRIGLSLDFKTNTASLGYLYSRHYLVTSIRLNVAYTGLSGGKKQ